MNWIFDWKASDFMMIILTCVIAGTGVIGLKLVFQGGEDTKRLVKASEIQACASKQQAVAAAQIAGASDRNAQAAQSFAASAEIIKKQAISSSDSLTNLVGKLDTANVQSQRDFESRVRPRLVIEKTEVSLPQGHEERTISVHLSYELNNEGLSTADRITPYFEFGSDFQDPLRDRDWSICQRATKQKRNITPSKVTEIFPDVPPTIEWYELPDERPSNQPIHVQGCVAYQMKGGQKIYFTRIDIRFNPTSPDKPSILVIPR